MERGCGGPCRQCDRSRCTANTGPAAAKRCFMLTSAAKSAAAARGRPRSASAVDHTSSPAPAHQSSRAPGDPCRARQKAYQNNEKRSQQQHRLAQTICTVNRTSSPAIATDATFGTQPVGTGSSDWPELTCSDDRRSGDTGLHAPTLACV